MRKTKIVCTIGPACESPEMVDRLITAGMNVARLNFAHGDYEEHGNRIRTIKAQSQKLNRPVATLLDVKGPEIRLGKLKESSYNLVENDSIILTTEEIVGDNNRVSVTYKDLPKDVTIGSIIMVDDGLIELNVLKIENEDVHCVVKNNGVLKSRKSVNLPGMRVNLPGVTKRDIEHILFGIKMGVDFIAASFVRKPEDVLQIREILSQNDANQIRIISKIENQEGIDNIDSIIEVTDGIMVARGDLGVEISVENVPQIQKMIINKCNSVGKPVITATHMLESMQINPRPTRAEATDVANAIFDGTDAVMLSGETAVGKYPVESVETMSRIAESAEHSKEYQRQISRDTTPLSITETISQSVSSIANEIQAKAIITPTVTGFAARMVGKYRPQQPIIAVTSTHSTAANLTLCRGVFPLVAAVETENELMNVGLQYCLDNQIVGNGDYLVVTAGLPLGQSGSTNMIKVYNVPLSL
ncbi:pyruvate kinase [Gorillibacterium massiliense]|uniref:pyruvate kinase n=1 Tax=Gorillibacterium massiliense TaxID=1280390 RepID=UPI0004B06736|nr:pyruvate kinase [Gorillibacterium massiliense]